jgi:hypothetical protein
MGRGRILIASTILISVLCACTTSTDEIAQKEQLIPVGGTAIIGTKDTRATMALQDKVISSEITMGMFAFRSDASTDGIDNPYTFTFDGAGAFTHSGDKTLYYPVLKTVTLNVYSYIPYDANYTDFNTSYDFTVKSSQITDADYLSSDLLYGTFSGAQTTNKPVIVYMHKLSRLDFTLTIDNSISVSDIQGAVVSLVGVKPTVKFNPSDGSISDASGTEVDIPFMKIPSDATTVRTYTASVRFPPQTISAGDFLKITFKDNVTVITVKLNNDFVAAGSTYYPYSYNLTATAVNGGGASVKKFDEVLLSGTAQEE